jgi:two-component system nitrate/nitrite response regulator NarL
MRKKRVLIVDDSAAVRTFVRHLFEVEPEFEITGQAENGQEALEKAKRLKPDLVILDLSMPVMNGLDAAYLLTKILPGVRIILFTVEEGDEVAQLAREAGIHAVVLKSEAASKLVLQAQTLLRWIE